uniref:Coiled-coil domain containing 124 n=1 Tax=Cyprinus carpio TaxID=7962 RepID=A0A8C1XZK1_CYPCA
MPKKFQGENSKSATARARKAEAKAVADARKQKELEDALWQETDKHVMKKDGVHLNKNRLSQNKKMTSRDNPLVVHWMEADLIACLRLILRKGRGLIFSFSLVYPFKSTEKSHLEMPLEENINQIVPEEGTMEARTIEDAIAVLSTKEDLDRHPERRMKAAYAAFEEANMARLKMENPNMRLSQLKQQLKKEWTKSPENPLNQRVAAYNSK